MDNKFFDKFIGSVSKSRTLVKLGIMAKNVTGGNLAIILRKNQKLRKIIPSGKDADLPDFCKMIRSSPDGAKLCMNCRALVGVACYRGTCEHSCHGGVAAFASPVFYPKNNASDFIVVTTCAFRENEEQTGWEHALKNLDGLNLDMRTLKNTFDNLRRLNPNEMILVKEIVECAAEALKDIIDSSFPSLHHKDEASSGVEHADEESNYLQENLQQVIDLLEKNQTAHPKGTLMNIVCSLIERNPEMPLRVIELAKAARLTPNHFSTLFKKETGWTFNTYLTEQRMKKANQLLANRSLSIKQVALKSGFDDPSYFIRRFKQIKGLTPKEWRCRRES